MVANIERMRKEIRDRKLVADDNRWPVTVPLLFMVNAMTKLPKILVSAIDKSMNNRGKKHKSDC